DRRGDRAVERRGIAGEREGLRVEGQVERQRRQPAHLRPRPAQAVAAEEGGVDQRTPREILDVQVLPVLPPEGAAEAARLDLEVPGQRGAGGEGLLDLDAFQ